MSALTFEIDIHVPSNPLAVAVLDLPAMIAAEKSKSASNAKDLVTAFSAAADEQGVPAEHFIERCAPARMPDVVVEYARLRDLTIIPVGEPAAFQQPIAETVIFGSGRPVLILPDDRQRTKPISLDTLGIAWDFSGPAARALSRTPCHSCSAPNQSELSPSRTKRQSRRGGADQTWPGIWPSTVSR